MVSALIVRAQILEGTWKVALNRQGLTTFSFNIFQPLEINFLKFVNKSRFLQIIAAFKLLILP